jgi:hypothetical protein
MPLDVSIIPTKQTLPNFAGIADTANTLMNLQKNKLAIQQSQQQMQANQAASSAIQGNIDQQGNLNLPGLIQALSNNPASAYNLPTIMNQVYQMENAKNQALNSQIQNVTNQNTQANQMLGGLIDRVNKGEKVTKDDYATEMGRLVANKVFTLDQAKLHMLDLPETNEKMPEFLNHHYAQTLSNDKQLELLIPQVMAISSGGATNILNIDKKTGKATIVGSITNTLTPADLARPVEYKDAEGKTITTTTEKFLNAINSKQSTTGNQENTTGNQGYTGRYTGQQTGQGQIGELGGVVTGISPSQSAAMTTAGTNAANQVSDLSKRAGDVPVRLSWLNQAQDLLANPNVQTGPGTDWRNKVKSAMGALSPDVAKQIGADKEVASYDELKKILTNYANMQSSTMGTGTDSRLNASITGNANPDISKMANQDIITKTKAIEKILAAKNKAFQNSGITADKFPQWESNFNDKLSVEPFVFSAMKPEQRTEFLSRLKEKDKSLNDSPKYQQFKKNLAEMVQSGLIKAGE